jgi:sugar phosphate isomerase/epimerase
MQPLYNEKSSILKVGINARVIKEVFNGPILAKEVELIEIGIDESGILKGDIINYDRLDQFASLGNKFSIHGPYGNDGSINMVDLGVKSKRNFEVMEKVFAIANYLNAKHIVVHGDKVHGDYREAFLNVISNLKHLSKKAKNYSITLVLENLHNEKNNDRIGILPHEILQVIKSVNEENLRFCFDIGHANLTANLYKFDILEFITNLYPYLYHMHVHDNVGIPEVVDEKFGDQHLPLGKGKIDYARIFQALERAPIKNLVLELHSTCKRIDIIKSIALLEETQNNLPNIPKTHTLAPIVEKI